MNNRKRAILVGLFALQAICAVYFVGDELIELFTPVGTPGLPESDAMELVLAIALVFSVVVTGNELRRQWARDRVLSRQIDAASGAFTQMLSAQFDEWGLTKAERDVAVLAIKGFSVAEMAELRNTKTGTVKAQCAAVYRKAGVSGRLQLLGLFLEDLVSDEAVKNAVRG